MGSMTPGALSLEVQRSSVHAAVYSGYPFTPRARRRLRDVGKDEYGSATIPAILYW